MSKSVKASDLLVRCLEQAGVTTIYGVPGEENADVMMSLLDSPIEFIVCRHEQGAAFMAEVRGRTTGMPGVCLATLGPGATNLVTGVANANFDHAPVVAITGQASTRRLHKESHQNMDAVSMFRPITKWSSSIQRPESIPEVVHKAFRVAAAEKPGATHIELPEDIAKLMTTAVPLRKRTAPLHSRASEADVETAARLVREAKTPIVLAGHGCIRSHATQTLHAFVAATGIHVANTFMGKGALSAENPHCLYAAGLGSRDHVTEAFEDADLVLCIGYDMIEWPPERWNVGRKKKIVHIDFDLAEADDCYQADAELVGDPAASLAALLDQLEGMPAKDESLLAHLREHVTRELHEFDDDEGFPIKPQRILSTLRRALEGDDLLISDVGAHKMWVARNYPVYEPGTCIISNGFCSMGIALPGAIGAQHASPDRRVVGLMGDGGFLMNVQELATAAQYNIPATFLVWEDGSYGLIGWKQEAQFGKTSHTVFQNPDLLRLAEAFGCHAQRVASAEDLGPALDRALQERTRPSVVIVPVDYRENMKLTRRLGELISH